MKIAKIGLSCSLITCLCHCGPSNEEQALRQWLHDNPRVAQAMTFDGYDGWDEWPNRWQDRLIQDFRAFTLGQNIAIEDPLVNHGALADLDSRGSVVAASEYLNEDAWRLYVNLVAHSLKVELNGELPWTVTSYSDHALAVLFSGEEIFTRHNKFVRPQPLPYTHFVRPDSFTTNGNALPTTATRAHQFMEAHNMVADNPLDTVGNVISWARDHLSHYGRIDPDTSNLDLFVKHWGYEGPAPVLRTLDGWSHPQFSDGHYTAGCHGTTGVLRALLHAVNIPVTEAPHQEYDTGFHSLTRFPSLKLNLSHGDDPYATRFTIKPWPITELLINDVTFESWFYPINGRNHENVGRQRDNINRKHCLPEDLRYLPEDPSCGSS